MSVMSATAREPRRIRVVPMFLAFAVAYFLSALLRAVTATLAPAFSAELDLKSADLGLLAGAYFFGFAAMQLPLGAALDRFGPRRVLVLLLVVAVAGCLGFASMHSIAGLIAARALIGVGVSACLMAPLTSYRRLLRPAAQLRANSWMLMTGSLGMVASTLPVQWLLPVWGWRGLFWALAAALFVALGLIVALVPADVPVDAGPVTEPPGYLSIVRHPLFVSLVPLGLFSYGGLIAVQALWAGPWLTRVSGWSANQAAQGLLAINFSMLVAFLAWGGMMPRLVRLGVTAVRLMTWGLPLSLVLLLAIVALGSGASAWHWTLWCVASTFVTLSQPAVGQAFPVHLAGRALSAFNLVVFVGVFMLQWGIGLSIDALLARGWRVEAAFQTTFGVYAVCCVMAYVWYLAMSSRSCR